MKNSVLLFTLLSCFFSFAQKVELKGKVLSPTKAGIESATVYLSLKRDSTLIDYTITNGKGEFLMPLRKISEPTFMTISYIGFQDLTKEIKEVKESLDFGALSMMLADNNVLDELIITADVAPIRVKKDTLEFNAASFKVRPDATVKQLLEQLPGVEVDEEGKIKVNGKEVSNVLVNGKPFFNADGKIAIENLPADIINKVQVTDAKTKEEKLSNAKASGDTKTINLTIDEDKNKGLFGRVIGGYGTDDRYEASLLFNYFKGKSKISVLGASNNINSTGFSTDEIFDNMSGGRNRSTYWSSDGSFSINGMRFGGGSGITETNMIGVNYSDGWGKDNTLGLNYLFNDITNNNKNVSRAENLLPDNRYITNSDATTYSNAKSNQFNYDMEVAIDSLTTFSITPKLNQSKGLNSSSFFSVTTNELGQKLNKSMGFSNSDSEDSSFENAFTLARRFKKAGRSLSLTFENSNTKNESNQTTESSTFFYQTNTPEDYRNQNIDSRNHKDNYGLDLVYREPIALNQILRFGFSTNWDNQFQGRDTNDFDVTSQSYSKKNELLSYTNILSGRKISPGLGYQYSNDKLYLNIGTETAFNNYDVSSYYNQNNYSNSRLDVLANANVSLNYSFTNTGGIYASYDYKEESPLMYQMLEYRDLSNPLNTTIGNKDLRTSQGHNTYIGFNKYDWQTRSGYNIYMGGDFNTRSTGMSQSYDANYKGSGTYVNVYDTYSYYLGGSYNKTFKISDKNKITTTGRLSLSGGLDKGYLNEVLYTSKRNSVSPDLRLTFDFDKKLTIQPSYNYSITFRDYENFTSDNTNYFRHNAGLMLTSYLPKRFVIGSDVNYTYNSNIAEGFKKDFILWNASLGYNFFEDQFLVKVKVYDILNQNQAVRRSTTATSIYDSQDTILKQYFMFSLTYKLNKFAGKKKSNSNFIIM